MHSLEIGTRVLRERNRVAQSLCAEHGGNQQDAGKDSHGVCFDAPK